MREHGAPEIAENLLEEAVTVWWRDGAVWPAMFAVGHARSIILSPADEEGWAIEDGDRAVLLGLAANLAGAKVIGRIDETYITERPVGEQVPEPGDLAELADTDPTIQTAIAVQALDLETDSVFVSLARLGMDDDGEPNWRVSNHEEPSGHLAEHLRATGRAIRAFPAPVPYDDAVAHIHESRWVVSDSDSVRDRGHG